MFGRLTQILKGSGELVRVESELALSKAKASLARLAVVSVCGFVGLLSVIGLLIAATAGLAAELGWITALALISGSSLILAVSIAFITSYLMHKSAKESRERTRLRREEAAAKSEISGDKGMSESSDQGPRAGEPASTDGTSAEQESWEQKAATYVVENPGKVASGAFAVLAVLGPFRALRLLSRGMMVAGLVSSASKELEKAQGSENQTEFEPDAPDPGAPAPEVPTNVSA